jgi:hypothetical protein
MDQIAGVYGNSNRDEYLSTTRVRHRDSSLIIELADGSRHSFRVPGRPSKVTLAQIPAEFKLNVSRTRAGGGVVKFARWTPMNGTASLSRKCHNQSAT